MATPETIVWGIHGGREGRADSLFMKKSVVAVGWPKMGDLSKIPATREAFRAKVQEAYPDKKPGARGTLRDRFGVELVSSHNIR